MLDHTTWYGQSTLLFQNGKRVWFDPWRLTAGVPLADIIFITHAHGDHLSSEDVERIRTQGTVLIGPPDCLEPLKGANKRVVKPGDELQVEGFNVKVVPAYNLEKPFHPKANNWVGYLVEIGGAVYYSAGDTDRIPELKAIKADVAFLPIGGTYTMDAEEAAAATGDFSPKMAVPYHYGSVVGSDADAQRFQQLAKVPVTIMKRAG